MNGEHVFTHNPAGAVVAHAGIGDDLPLCGFASDADTIGGTVTCGDCLAAQGMRKVSMDELAAIWDELRASGRIENGATDRELRGKYGDSVRHVAGDGWYVPQTAQAAQ